MRSLGVAANSRLKTEIRHVALWLGACLLGGSVLVMTSYLAVGNMIGRSFCSTPKPHSAIHGRF
jgi:hypothetical protein